MLLRESDRIEKAHARPATEPRTCMAHSLNWLQVRGEFNLQSDNHGKPVYKKNGQAPLTYWLADYGIHYSDSAALEIATLR